jgi:hypothetical protein
VWKLIFNRISVTFCRCLGNGQQSEYSNHCHDQLTQQLSRISQLFGGKTTGRMEFRAARANMFYARLG